MKKLMFVFSALLCLLWIEPAKAQDDMSDQFICIYRADMETYCPGLLSDLEAKYGPNLGVNPNVKSASKIAGLSNEIGTAVNEALTSLTQRSEQIAQTKAGKLTLIMIAYKIMGKSLIRVAFGLPILLLIFFLIFKWWKRIGIPQITISEIAKEKDEDGEIRECDFEYPVTGNQFIWGIIFLISLWICISIIV